MTALKGRVARNWTKIGRWAGLDYLKSFLEVFKSYKLKEVERTGIKFEF